MIKAEITKNVLNKSTSIVNFTKKQLIVFAVGCGIGLATFFGLRSYMPTELLMWIIFIEAILIIGFGVVRINGMNLFSFIMKMTKNHDRRYYSKEDFLNEKTK